MATLLSAFLGSALPADAGSPTTGEAEFRALRAAIQDLADSFGARYPDGRAYLDRLEALEREWRDRAPGTADTTAPRLEALRREALLANPLVRQQPFLFVTRPPYVNNHGTEETMYQSNEHNVDCFRRGGALKVLDVPSGQVRTVLEAKNGIVRDPEVHFDGRRVLFSMRRDRRDDYHLYELELETGNLRQLTFAPRVTDIQPVYLPNGQVMFSSTREPKYIPCQRHLMANLFVMDGDGANIHQIGHNTQFEGRGSLLPDGRVLYTRWEYVDKHFSSAYGLWSVNPDGTAQTLFYGGMAWQPGAIVDAQAIPGSPRVLCVFTSVHDLEWGALVVVDPARGNDGPAPIVRSWPPDLSPYLQQWNTVGRVGGEHYDAFMRVPLKYQNPFPLSDRHFLCARMIAPGNPQMALFLVDTFGNELLLHEEAPGCFQPRPLASRPRPPVIAPRTDPGATEGTFYVYDVYRGPGMETVRRGAVKALRVIEAPAKLTYPPNGHGDWSAPGDAESHTPTAVNWNHYNTKRVLGTVPVEPDGSVHFAVPAGRFVYFQLLDENGMMVHSMRSGTTLQPGERAGCVGCHDYRSAPSSDPLPMAWRRAPSPLAPWYGPPRHFNYAAEVQPVFDRHCVRCHDYGREAGTNLVLSGDAGPVFNASYVALMARSPALWTSRQKDEKPLVSTIGTGPVPAVGPYTWGATRSRLLDHLRAGHKEVRLSAEDLDRIVTWIDLNAPYYPEYSDPFTANTYGRCPLDHRQLLRLGQLVRGAPEGQRWGWDKVDDYTGGRLNELLGLGELPINCSRPESSACLRAFPDPSTPEYAEALELIRAGQRQLLAQPRADTPGFVPCAEDQERLTFHAWRQQVEARNRRGLAQGRKVYDDPVQGSSAVGLRQ